MYKKIFIVLIIFLAVVGLIFLLAEKKTKTAEDQSGDNGSFSFKTAVGQKAPDFTLPDINGNNIMLSGLSGKNVILFFNEGLMCYPACLDQVVELSKDEKLNNEETVSFSIVADSPKNWIKAQKDLPYLAGAKVLFDSGAQISRVYDTLKLQSSMHKGLYPGHTYFLIDKDGIVRFTLDDPYMGIRNDELVKEIEKLK